MEPHVKKQPLRIVPNAPQPSTPKNKPSAFKKWDVTLLAWFLVMGTTIFCSGWWLKLDWALRSISMLSVFVAAFFLILNFNLKSLGMGMLIEKAADSTEPLSQDDKLRIAKVLKQDTNHRRVLILFFIVALTYGLAAVSACVKIKSVEELYVYIVGWAVLCVFFDNQIRLHLLSDFIRRVLLKT